MVPANILKFPVSSPADTSPLQELTLAAYDASKILAVVGKSEGMFPESESDHVVNRSGNGCVNDFSRTLSALVWEPLIPPEAVTVFSGGTKGVLSPHVTFFVKERKSTSPVAAVG